MSRFDEAAELFQSVDGTERLELLLDYADRMPALPEPYDRLRAAGLGLVHECQSPVFLLVERGEADRVRVRGYVPEEAPTARGFTSLLIEAFDDAPAADVAAAPADALRALGLASLLGMQRTRGLSAVYARLRTEAARLGSRDAGGDGAGG